MTQETASLLSAAAKGARDYCDAARAGIAARLAPDGRLDAAVADREQRLLHGRAWIATTAEALTQSADWAHEAQTVGQFGPMDELALRIGFGEYLHQLASGIPVSQNEIVRPGELGLDDEAAALRAVPEVEALLKAGNTAQTRLELSRRLASGEAMGRGLVDETMRMIGAEFGRVAETRIVPGAQGWHLQGERASFDADSVVLAAGAWSAALLRPLGLDVPLESQRGYHLHLRQPGIALGRPVVLADRKIFISPMETGLRIAGTVEFGGLDAPPTERRAAMLGPQVKPGLPGIRLEQDGQTWMGHRPCMPDSMPVIGPVPGLAGLWCAFGHGHLGLTGAANTGLLIAAAMRGDNVMSRLRPFSITRFRH